MRFCSANWTRVKNKNENTTSAETTLSRQRVLTVASGEEEEEAGDTPLRLGTQYHFTRVYIFIYEL